MMKTIALSFYGQIQALLIKSLKLFVLMVATIFYVVNTAQAATYNPLSIKNTVTVTHSHEHESEYSHENDHDHHHDDDQQDRDQHEASGHESAHSHSILLASPAAYITPKVYPLIAIQTLPSAFIDLNKFDPPVAPGLGSIFRPPIMA